jgi:general secretion pathway protein K
MFVPRDPNERGYALIAVVASIAVFSAIALAAISATRIDIVKGRGEVSNVRGRMAAQAGMAIALHGLITGNPETLALLDGREQELEYEGFRIAITLTDERGKVSLNSSDGPTIDRMLNEAGLDLSQAEIARDSLMDWIDPDDETSPNGSEAPYYASRGITPRNGTLLSIDELAAIRGFTPQLIARLRPFVTVEPEAVRFSPRYASAQALAAAGDSRGGAIAQIERKREAAGQRTAIALDADASVIGRPITITIAASTPDRGRYQTSAIVVLTGKSAHPYVVRRVDSGSI